MKSAIALFMTASPSREKPLVENRSIYNQTNQVGSAAWLLPGEKLSAQLTDVGCCPAQRDNDPAEGGRNPRKNMKKVVDLKTLFGYNRPVRLCSYRKNMDCDIGFADLLHRISS